MTEAERLRRDLDTLRESIQRDWQEISQVSSKERDSILEHLMCCEGELVGLRVRLEALLDA